MRFALMTEPQQGLSLRRPPGDRPASGGERLRGVLSGPTTSPASPGCRAADDRRLDDPRRPRPRDPADRAGRPRLAGHVPAPGHFAKVVTTVDEMSGGRIEVGVGAGWNELEHQQLGLAFPPIKERADLMEDQLAILRPVGGAGRLVVRRAERSAGGGCAVPAAPRPGGGSPGLPAAGRGRGSSSAGRGRHGRSGWPPEFADEFNLSSASPARRPRSARCSTRRARPSGATRRHWRSRRWPACSSAGTTARWPTGRGRCWRPSGRRRGRRVVARGTRTRWVFGTPDEARAQVARFAAAGMERIMLQDFLPWDLDMVDVMGEEFVGRA